MKNILIYLAIFTIVMIIVNYIMFKAEYGNSKNKKLNISVHIMYATIMIGCWVALFYGTGSNHYTVQEDKSYLRDSLSNVDADGKVEIPAMDFDTEYPGELVFKVNKTTKNYIAGEDFPVGRYTIISKSKAKQAFFARTVDGKKFASEMIGQGEKTVHKYTATFTQGMKWRFMHKGTIKMIPDDKVVKNNVLHAGDWTVGENIELKDGKYFIKFTGDGSVYVVRNGEFVDKAFSSEKGASIKVQQGDIIRLQLTNKAILVK